MNPSSTLHLLFIVSVTLGIAAISIGKDSSPSLPPAPSASWDSREALEMLAQVTSDAPPEPLMAWLFHQSFGGRAQPLTWIEHPRVCQALWLALATHGLSVANDRSAQSTSLAEVLDHFQRQKALDGTTVTFFRSLWADASADSLPKSAADYLTTWCQTFDLPMLTPAEKTALSTAVASGVITLHFVSSDPIAKKE